MPPPNARFYPMPPDGEHGLISDITELIAELDAEEKVPLDDRQISEAEGFTHIGLMKQKT